MRFMARYITLYTNKPTYRYVYADNLNYAVKQAERYADKGKLKGYKLEKVEQVL